jgi:hypothetical protein
MAWIEQFPRMHSTRLEGKTWDIMNGSLSQEMGDPAFRGYVWRQALANLIGEQVSP